MNSFGSCSSWSDEFTVFTEESLALTCSKAPFIMKGRRRSLEQTREDYGQILGQKRVRGLDGEKRICLSFPSVLMCWWCWPWGPGWWQWSCNLATWLYLVEAVVQRFDDNRFFSKKRTYNFGNEMKNMYGDLACILANRFLNIKSLCLW